MREEPSTIRTFTSSLASATASLSPRERAGERVKGLPTIPSFPTAPAPMQTESPSPRLAPSARPRRLIVNADDFGASPSINQAVIRAHHEGILTSASLMVNEPGFDEAVALAHETPTLGVGL